MSRRLAACSLTGILLLGTAGLVTGAAAGSGPQAHVARTCHLSLNTAKSLGPTYVTSLKVRNTSCSAGKQLVTAYYKCRYHEGGVAGHCHHHVLRYRCHERRHDAISIQYSANVTCVRGNRVVVHTYTQDT